MWFDDPPMKSIRLLIERTDLIDIYGIKIASVCWHDILGKTTEIIRTKLAIRNKIMSVKDLSK